VLESSTDPHFWQMIVTGPFCAAEFQWRNARDHSTLILLRYIPMGDRVSYQLTCAQCFS
jgi:hypothetical protein